MLGQHHDNNPTLGRCLLFAGKGDPLFIESPWWKTNINDFRLGRFTSPWRHLIQQRFPNDSICRRRGIKLTAVCSDCDPSCLCVGWIWPPGLDNISTYHDIAIPESLQNATQNSFTRVISVSTSDTGIHPLTS